MFDFANIWEMVDFCRKEKEEKGIPWEHYFWTNVPEAVTLNETVCQGRCFVKTFNELPPWEQMESLVNQLVKNKFYAIDVLKPVILYHIGGIYMDTDFNLIRSVAFLHTVLDLYTGDEGLHFPGVAAGIFAARKHHQACKTWMDFLFGYYGIAPDVYGAREIMPMPTFRDDISWSSGPRASSFGVWANLNKWGNNDAIFKMTMLNLDMTHHSWKFQKFYGYVVDDNPREETITIGGERYHFDQFGFQFNTGTWHVPAEAFFELEDGRTQNQYWLFDFSDKEDILRPNYVTKDTIASERARYSDRPLVQWLFYDIWFPEYFKKQTGAYMDNMQLPEQKKNHLEMEQDGDEIGDEWYWETQESEEANLLSGKAGAGPDDSDNKQL